MRTAVVNGEDWGARAARWTGIRSETLDVQGTGVRLLRVDGPGDGTPQLLVHGLGGSSTNWLEVMVELAAFGPVVAPDLPGFGRTEPPNVRSGRVPAQAAFVRALADRLGWGRVVLHGNSMGGLIALLAASSNPDLVERLVLVAPAVPTPLHRTNQIPPATLARFAPFVNGGFGQLVMRRLQDRFTPEQMWAGTRDLVYADPGRVTPEIAQVGIDNLAYARTAAWRPRSFAVAANSIVRMLVGTRRVLAAVDGVVAPTLLVWGDGDQLVGRAAVERVTARRPDWGLHVFRDIGHVPQIESPAAYLDVVGAWLEQGVPGERTRPGAGPVSPRAEL